VECWNEVVKDVVDAAWVGGVVGVPGRIKILSTNMRESDAGIDGTNVTSGVCAEGGGDSESRKVVAIRYRAGISARG